LGGPLQALGANVASAHASGPNTFSVRWSRWQKWRTARQEWPHFCSSSRPGRYRRKSLEPLLGEFPGVFFFVDQAYADHVPGDRSSPS